MGVLAVLAEVVVVLSVLLLATLGFVVGPTQLRRSLPDLPNRLRIGAKPLGVLLAVLLLNSVVRDYGVTLSWIIGTNITDEIFALEGAVVATLQSATPLWLTYYFGYVYVYGYVFLLVFPLVAYLAADDPTPLRTTAIAYALNYVGGLACYVVFIAYGPRNFIPELVEPLLYTSWPESQLLTSRVNHNTNVFPSLHSSLSITVVGLAALWRDLYPNWLYLAAPLGTAVSVSTMYLGIHWAVDVVAGAALGVGSVAGARLLTRRLE
jgi:membrane-associated phospholipid phosphatase